MQNNTRQSMKLTRTCAIAFCGTQLLGWAAGCASKAERPAPSASGPSKLVQAAPAQPAPQARPTVSRRGTLFERMGGEPVVRAVVDDLVAAAAADPAVNFTRQGHGDARQVQPAQLKQALVAFFTTTAGGPEQYRGSDMVSAHRGMAITNAEFDAFARHLSAALEKNGVGRREREELLSAVATTRAAIVETPDAPPADAAKVDTSKAPTPGSNDAASDSAQAEVPQAEVAPEEGSVETAPGQVVPTEANPEDAPPAVTPAEEMKPEAGPSDQPKPAPADEPVSEEYEPESNG